MASPFHIQPLITSIHPSTDLLEFDNEPKGSEGLVSAASSISAATKRATTSPSSKSGEQKEREIVCVEGYGYNIYVGGSDGTIEWWVNEGPSRDQTNGWAMRHKHTLFPKRPVQRMFILPKVSKILAISDGTLHALHLPSLEPVNSSAFPQIRGVISVILNDDELDWNPGSEEKTDMTIVIVRRKVLGIYKLGTRLQSIKEIPLPSNAPTNHALFQTYLCCVLRSADTSQLLNCIIDLSDASLTEVLPVSQVPVPEGEEDTVNPNIVVIPGEGEFLVTSFTGSSTMGVFLNGQGDPVRGTMEWEAHPLSIAVESGWIIALLSNQTIAIHSIDNLDQPAQSIPLPANINAKSLSYSPYGVRTKDISTGEKMRIGREKFLTLRLLPQLEQRPSPERKKSGAGAEEDDEPTSGSGLTPPSSPRPSRRKHLSDAPFITSMSETLLFTPTSILSLIPIPPVTILQNLLAENQLNDAIAFVDDFRRRLRRGELAQPSPFDPPSSHTLKYLSLLLASHLTASASFQRAGEYWLRGKVDPRWVVRLFEGWRGKLIGRDEEGEVQEGLRKVWEEMESINEIITSSIKRNYSPHLPPSTLLSPASTDLRKALEEEAEGMLLDILRKTRVSRRKGGGTRGIDSRKIDIVVDTVLAKLLTLSFPTTDGQVKDNTNELLQLLASSNDVVVAELEPFLEKRPYILARVMIGEGRSDRVLQILRGMEEKGESDALCDEPVEEIADTLENVKDEALWEEYLLWLVPRRPERSLSLIISFPPPTLSPPDLLPKLLPLSPQVHQAYLEHIVITNRSPSRSLHQHLLSILLDEVGVMGGDEGVKYHLAELDEEYKKEARTGSGSAREKETFLHFMARIAPDTPIKRLRLKLAFFLQGSPFYDVNQAKERMEGIDGVEWEKAIVYGKLGNHKAALELLALRLQDPLSALTYATSSGEILPPRLARSVASISNVGGLEAWATLGEVGRKKKKKEGEEEVRVEAGLVRDLLDVYMSDGSPTSLQSASSLLNTHSHLLPLLPLLTSMPSSWPLRDVSTFFIRSLRRSEETRWEGMVKKNLGREEWNEWNETWLDEVTRMGPVVRAKTDDGRDGDGDEKGEEFDEKEGYTLGETGPQDELSEKTPGSRIDAERQRLV